MPSAPRGPASEQLDLPEDIERLCDIGDLVLAGHARLEDFDLGTYERGFLDGYVNPTKGPRWLSTE